MQLYIESPAGKPACGRLFLRPGLISWPTRGADLEAALPVHVHKSIEGEYLSWHLLCVGYERGTLLVFAYAVDAVTSSCQVASQFLRRCIVLWHTCNSLMVLLWHPCMASQPCVGVFVFAVRTALCSSTCHFVVHDRLFDRSCVAESANLVHVLLALLLCNYDARVHAPDTRHGMMQ